MPIPIIPTIAGAAAVAAYLDGKYQIRQDVRSILGQKAAERHLIDLQKKDRMCLWYAFEEKVNQMPANDECIWSREGCYTWRETYDQACRYGAFLQSQGVQPRELVATILTNTPVMAFHWVGCWSIGCAPALINYHLTGDALVHCIKVSGAKIVVVDWDPEVCQRVEEMRSIVEGELGLKIIILDEATRASINALPARRPDDKLRQGMTADYPMCLLYTSGSTGHPKAVAFGMGRGSLLGGNRIRAIGINPGPNGDRYYICMPLYHGTGGVAMVSSLMAGVTVCMGKKFSTSKFWDEIRDSNATAFVYVGETARYLLAAPPSPRDKDHKVRVMFGNGMRPEVWVRFRERFGIDTIAEFFNSTEGVFSLLNISRGPFTDACVGQHGGILRFLLRNFYVAAEIDHETGDLWRDPKTGFGKRKSLEEGGEMLVGVPNEQAFAGYWKNKDATDKKFAKDLFKKGDLWYRSGDALRRDKDGRWYFMDRLGDTYRWKSENVATADVSERLGYSPGMVEAIVYGVLVPGHDGRAGTAAISLTPETKPDAAYFKQLLKYSLEHLPRYAVPVFIRLQPGGSTAMHNQKQNKVPLKKDGIDLDAIYGKGKDFKDALAEGRDLMYWWPAGVGHMPSSGGDPDAYVPFERKDWEALKAKHKENVARL
ncbi:uncharacterized protein PV09_00389 [Verruconis gallopava]|uniref:Very long-chain fatty acid transport protein n=1 Tax=Verruconis gallopava TaxID=253628 RepID=A0A0D2AS65_9PEZI|nr:uncharacterized protein PV09_00389 [Verruconis gallopava]KIW09513.1 hypothetical protein PV09_00389 [Verruconis gallopava]